jgi:hypothetical protein
MEVDTRGRRKRMMRLEAKRKRDHRLSTGEPCPSCGSPVHGDATASGIDIHFCSRCAWYQVRSADGQVAEEDPASRHAAA